LQIRVTSSTTYVKVIEVERSSLLCSFTEITYVVSGVTEHVQADKAASRAWIWFGSYICFLELIKSALGERTSCFVRLEYDQCNRHIFYLRKNYACDSLSRSAVNFAKRLKNVLKRIGWNDETDLTDKSSFLRIDFIELKTLLHA